MAKKTDDKKAPQTLRQAASAQSQPKKRSLRAVRTVKKPASKKKPTQQTSKIKRVGRWIIPKYFRQSWMELRQVSWPDRRQTVKLTFAVIMFATVFGVVLAIIDFGLDKLFKSLLLK